MEDQFAALAEKYLSMDEFCDFCDVIKLAMHNKTQEVANNMQAQFKDVEAWMRDQGTRVDNLESSLREMASNITTETTLVKTVADMRESVQEQVTRLQNTLKQLGARVNDTAVARERQADSEVDVSRVLLIENALKGLSDKLEQKADLARVERYKASFDEELVHVDEGLAKLADSMKDLLRLRQSPSVHDGPALQRGPGSLG